MEHAREIVKRKVFLARRLRRRTVCGDDQFVVAQIGFVGRE
jgi:hypothetical protein